MSPKIALVDKSKNKNKQKDQLIGTFLFNAVNTIKENQS